MTRKEAAGVIKFEKACVLRQDTPQCHRDCKKCDLLLPTEDVLTAYDMAIKALEQEPCEDCISRQAAIEAFDGVKVDEENCTEYDIGYNDGIDFAVSRLSVLPPAQPEIIRCKDCKHWRFDHTCREHSLVSPMMANEFCSRAERREG